MPREQDPSAERTKDEARSGVGGGGFAIGDKVQFMSVAHRGSGIRFSTCIGTIKEFSKPQGLKALVRKRNGRDEWKRVSELRALNAKSPVNDVFDAIVEGARSGQANVETGESKNGAQTPNARISDDAP